MNKKSKIVLGISLIIIGLIWLLKTLGITIISYGGFIEAVSILWPIVFIAIGLTIIFPNKVIKTCVWVFFILMLIAVSVYETRNMAIDNNTYYYYNNGNEYIDF